MNFPGIFLLFLLTFQIRFAEAQQYRAVLLDKTANQQVKSIVQDGIGFLWIASNTGLHRYDGTILEPYLQKVNSQSIRHLIKTNDRRILFSCDDGIYEIQSSADTAIVSLLFPSAPILTDTTLYNPNKIFVTSNGALWVSESGGFVARIDESKIQRFELGLGNTPNELNGSFSFAEDQAGNLWTASQSGYVFRYDETQDQFIEMLDADRLGTINQLIATDDGRILLLGDRVYSGRVNQNGFLDNVLALVELPGEINYATAGPQGKMYFGTNLGLYRATHLTDFRGFEKVLVHNAPHRVEELPFDTINQIDYSGGELWVSTNRGGFLLQSNF